jgi:hypothetical protein
MEAAVVPFQPLRGELGEKKTANSGSTAVTHHERGSVLESHRSFRFNAEQRGRQSLHPKVADHHARGRASDGRLQQQKRQHCLWMLPMVVADKSRLTTSKIIT